VLTAGLVFGFTYIAVALGGLPGLRIDRAGAAVVGAALMVALRVLTPEQAYSAIDLPTLVLLFGMMILVGHLRLAGFFRLVGVRVAQAAGTPHQLLAGLVASAGLLSALFVNDTVCLALTPLVLEVTAASGVRATPYLIALATASNIGSCATLTGNPQNMLIGSASHMSYGTFLGALAPVALVGLLLDYLVIAWVYRHDLNRPFRQRPRPRIKVHRFLMIKALVATAVMVAFFFAGANLPMVALSAGAALLVTRRVRSEKIFREVNWSLLALFAGLFVVVAAARAAGLTERAFAGLHAEQAHSTLALTALVAGLSNLVSNVPAVLLFVPLVPQWSQPEQGWQVLAMASTLAGNLTLLGSIANLIVAEGARKSCPLTFVEYLKVGVPVTLLTLAAGVVLLS
jgi:Na+/H+ antiporter NhaD/arsenite permease-like protein